MSGAHTVGYVELLKRRPAFLKLWLAQISSLAGDWFTLIALYSLLLEYTGKGESVGLMGLNGSGKSTLLKLISGVMRPDSGSVLTRGRIAGLIATGAGFDPQLTGRDNLYLNAAILGMSRAETDRKFDEIVDFADLGKFLDTEVAYYSSGMKARLGFAVAISEYQNFTQRAQVSEGASLAAVAKVAIAEYALGNGTLPQSNSEAGLPAPAEMTGAYVSYVDIGKHPGRIEIGFSSQSPQHAHQALDVLQPLLSKISELDSDLSAYLSVRRR